MAESRNLTPAQYVADLGALVKRTILRAAEKCDPAWRSITAATLGKSRQRIDDVCDLGDDAQLSVRDALAYPEPIRHALAQELVGDGNAVVSLPAATEAADDWHLAARAQRETGEALAATLEAIADGRVTASEGARLERECTEAVAALLGIRERARAAQRDRVVGIRRAK